MAFDTKNLNAYDFIKSFRQTLGDTLQERLESGEFFPLLESVRESRTFDSEEDAKKFVAANRMKHPSAPKQSSKSDKWNVVIDAQVASHGKGSQSNKSRGMFNEETLHEGLTSYEAQRLRVGTVDPKTKKIHKDAFNTAKTHFLGGNSIDDAVKKAKEKHDLNEEVEQLEENIRKDATDIDWTLLGGPEKDVVLKVRELGRHLGSDMGAYASGVLMLTFKNKQAVEDFATALEDEDMVDTYDIEAVREDLVGGFVEDEEYDFGDIMFDKDFEFNVYVYLIPEIVALPAEELEVGEDFEWDDNDETGFMMEVRRKIKVNFRGKKRIKMQCSPGFKWDGTAKTCKKISGAQVAVMRKAMRRAVLTKKSMGQSFKARVVRKSRKANRFRKSFGLN